MEIYDCFKHIYMNDFEKQSYISNLYVFGGNMEYEKGKSICR